MNVKKLIAITTLCAAALCSGTYISVSADTDGITIPDSFSVELSLDSITDYAVGKGQYAFADGNKIYIYEVNAAESSGYNYVGGEITVYEHTSSILALEYSDDKLYFSDGAAYLYSDGSATAAEFTFTAFSDSARIDDGDYIYYIYNGSVFLYNTTTQTSDSYGNASTLKEIDGCGVFVLKDSALCILSDGVLTEISFSYDDYENIAAIATGGTAQALSESKAIQTAAIPAGACIIRVSESSFDGDNFTLSGSGVSFAESDLTAQILYMPDGGNAALVAVGSKTYLTLKTNLTVTNYSAAAVSSQSYYLLDGAGVYSMPFESSYTKIADAAKDTVVTVSGYVSGDAFDYSYYKVEYTDDGNTVSGYVIANLLTEYSFANDNYETEEIKDGDQSTDNDIMTIVLVMIIVVLVLIAAGYITFVVTSDKKKRKKK